MQENCLNEDDDSNKENQIDDYKSGPQNNIIGKRDSSIKLNSLFDYYILWHKGKNFAYDVIENKEQSICYYIVIQPSSRDFDSGWNFDASSIVSASLRMH